MTNCIYLFILAELKDESILNYIISLLANSRIELSSYLKVKVDQLRWLQVTVSDCSENGMDREIDLSSRVAKVDVPWEESKSRKLFFFFPLLNALIGWYYILNLSNNHNHVIKWAVKLLCVEGTF